MSAAGVQLQAVDDPMMRLVDAEAPEALDQVRRLFRAYADEYGGSIAESLCFQGFEAELAGLPGRYAPPSGCLLLAVEGSIPAGCVALRSLDGTTCEMKLLYVVPKFRGKGVGRLLVEEIIRRGEQAGYQRMVLDTLPEMSGALVLYQRFGFVEAAPYWDCPIERTIYLERPLRHPRPSAPD